MIPLQYEAGAPSADMEESVNLRYSPAIFGQRPPFSDVRFFDGDDNGDDSGNKSGDAITFNSQEDLDRLVQKRLDRQKESLKNDKDFVGEIRAAIEGERTQEQLKEQGKFEDMYNAEVTKVADLETKIANLKTELAERDLKDLRRQIAEKHKIPEALVDRLQGKTEEEITADAKALAKSLNLKAEEENKDGEEAKPPAGQRKPPVDNDAGKGARRAAPAGERPGERDDNGKPKSGSFAFVKQGDVSWGNR